jgi:murein DD-endopeptidase MepM/ murein hydrolase activator NlpD
VIDNILAQQYIDGHKYSSPLLSKDGNRQTVFFPNQRVSENPHQSLDRIRQAPITRQVKQAPDKQKSFDIPSSRHIPRREKRYKQQVHTQLPVIYYIIIIIAVLLFSFVVLTWQPGSLNRGVSISPGEDSTIQGDLAAYAGLGERPEVGADFPLQITELFTTEPYTVRKGDTVSELANRYKVSMGAIIALNNIPNARLLREGTVLKIPNMDGIPYIVKNRDTYGKIAEAMKIPLDVILDANDIQNEEILAGTMLFVPGAHMKNEDLKMALGDSFMWPIKNRITSPFGWRPDPFTGAARRAHEGIDIAANIGNSVKAAMDGRAVTIGRNDPVYGNYVILSHSNGFQTLYAHLSIVSVKLNDSVRQGVKIGEAGKTGYATGSHLHFGVYKNGKSVDPLLYLEKR